MPESILKHHPAPDNTHFPTFAAKGRFAGPWGKDLEVRNKMARAWVYERDSNEGEAAVAQEMSRREAIALGLGAAVSLSLPVRASDEAVFSLVQAHDAKLQKQLESQITDAQSRWCGAVPDGFGIHYCHTAAEMLKNCAAAYFHPKSAHHGSGLLPDRMRLLAGFLTRFQNAEGNIDLFATNFNSPPDTGFVVHHAATAAKLAQMNGDDTVLSLLKDFLLRAGDGLSKGGIHTPNHRWVVSAALAQINDLYPDSRYVARIDQWLAEGIDIDADGQYTERSTAGYNAVVNDALVTVAHKLSRPELLDPVRKNLDAMAYLLHPDGEVVTEISRRQDLNTRGTMDKYWFGLRYLAVRDGGGLYASMCSLLRPESADLARLMEYPELEKPLADAVPLPDNYEKDYPSYGVTRIRRGKTSATILYNDNNRWFSVRRGAAVVNAVRFAGAFFGKGQFVPAKPERRADGFYFRQVLQGRYMQPITDPSLLPVSPDAWSGLVMRRKATQVCRLVYDAGIRETGQGFELSISARGTDNVPFAVEINLREGGELTGVVPAPNTGEAFLLKEGFAEYRVGGDGFRFGPGRVEHAWVQMRGTEAKLPGPSVYLTGYTPFQHTLTFQVL